MTLERRKPLTRTVGLHPRNRKRRRAAHARNFGDEADAVRAMPCLCWGKPATQRHPCRGDIQAAHVTARGGGGAKGGRFDLVPLCAHHHREAGEADRPGETGETQRDRFEKRYGLDLRLEADHIAFEHAMPLGIRGLADRWVIRCACGHEWRSRPDGCDCIAPKTTALDSHERDALLGWVRRDIERSVAAFMQGWNRAISGGVRPDADGPVLARDQAVRWMAASLALDESSARALSAAAEVGRG